MNTAILSILLFILVAFNLVSFIKWRIYCHTQGRNFQGMWKVPFRMIYHDSVWSWIGSTFHCLIWLKIHPPKFTGLSIGAIALCTFLISSCSSTSIESSLPTIKVASQVGTTFAIHALKITPADQQNIYDLALAINAVTGGDIAPTVAELQNSIAGYVTTPGAEAVGSFVTALYSQYYPQLSGNAKVATDFLQAVSAGVVLATQNNSAALAQMKTLPLNVRIAIWRVVHK